MRAYFELSANRNCCFEMAAECSRLVFAAAQKYRKKIQKMTNMYRAMDVNFHPFVSEKYAIFVRTCGRLAGMTTLKRTGRVGGVPVQCRMQKIPSGKIRNIAAERTRKRRNKNAQ